MSETTRYRGPDLTEFDAELQANGGDSIIFDRIAAGETVEAIMKDHGLAGRSFYRWVQMHGRESDRIKAWREAQRISADAHAQNVLTILDEADDSTTATIQKAKARADVRKWLAERFNRTQYGDTPPQLNVGFNVTPGSLLEALRDRGTVEAGRLAQAKRERRIAAGLPPHDRPELTPGQCWVTGIKDPDDPRLDELVKQYAAQRAEWDARYPGAPHVVTDEILAEYEARKALMSGPVIQAEIVDE